MPISPGICERNQVAPISGKKPMEVSGIANRKLSPATRCEPCTETPAPPPITMPIDQRNVRLRITLDRGVENILVTPIGQRIIMAPRTSEVVDRADVAAGGECSSARRR